MICSAVFLLFTASVRSRPPGPPAVPGVFNLRTQNLGRTGGRTGTGTSWVAAQLKNVFWDIVKPSANISQPGIKILILLHMWPGPGASVGNHTYSVQQTLDNRVEKSQTSDHLSRLECWLLKQRAAPLACGHPWRRPPFMVLVEKNKKKNNNKKMWN